MSCRKFPPILLLRLTLAVLGTILLPGAALADVTIGGSCSGTVGTGPQTNGNNAACVSSLWQYPGYIFGALSSTSTGCASANAGQVQYNGGSFYGCNGSTWSAFATGVSALLGTSTGSANPQRSGDPTTGLLTLTTTSVSIETGGVEALRVTATQSVGIGTTAPDQLLEVYNGTSAMLHLKQPSINDIYLGSTTVPNFSFTFAGADDGILSSYNPFDIGTTGSYPITFATNGSQRLSITSTGSVGIGTTAPDQLLTITTSAAAWSSSPNTTIDLKESGYGNPTASGTVSNGDKIILWNRTDAGGGTGLKVAIGADAYGLTLQSSNISNAHIGFWTGSGNSSVAPTEAMRITSTQSVGIGTTAPASLVQVYNGEVQVGSSGNSCTSSNAGAIRYNGTTMQYCNGSAWSFFKHCTPQGYIAESASPGCCGGTTGVYSDNTYVYDAHNSNGLYAYTFNGTSWSASLASVAIQTQGFYDVTKGGGYIFTAEGSDGIRAFTFNGSSFTQKASISSTGAVNLWSDGTNVFVADRTGGVRWYTFNGSSFTLKSTYAPSGVDARGVWSDGTYLYATDAGNNKLYALSYSGSSLTQLASVTGYAGGNGFTSVVAGGGYIYATEAYIYGDINNVLAYTFNGSSFTNVGSFNANVPVNGYWNGIAYQAGLIYVGLYNSVIVLTFNGSSFSVAGMYPVNNGNAPVAADSSYFYSGNGVVWAYPICY